MHVTVARHASPSKSQMTHFLSSSSMPQRCRSGIGRRPSYNIVQARTLWWWSRHGREWSAHDEHLEEKMRRFQKIMRYKYSKALRRRALWDQEDGFRSLWGWRLPRRWLGGRWADWKSLSSGKPMQADVHDPHGNGRPDRDPWDDWNKQWNRDYESFKAAVDKAINRDPYGTLFGRHLRSPMSSRNSGWTAWSWVFEPKIPSQQGEKNASEQEKKPDQTAQSSELGEHRKSGFRPAFSVPPKAPNMPKKASSLVSDGNYEIDPITMRKVPKASESKETGSDGVSEKKPFLSSLFGEHGAVDIPVKTYKPHKIYGYGANQSSPKADVGAQTDVAESKPRGASKGFENSRLRELQRLRASSLGNSIDTTAEYGGKYINNEKAVPVPGSNDLESTEKRVFDTDDDAPLFSGTTYQSKADEIIASKTPKADWLRKEGFQSVDRGLGPDSTAASSKLETSLDRIAAKARTDASSDAKTLEESFNMSAQKQREEDADLLRASDVRAAARTARKTKQQFEQGKKEVREKLENDYTTPQQEPEGYGVPVGKIESKLAKNLKTAWKHISEYPQGVVARTMQSLGLYNSDFRNYVRLDKPAVNLTEKLVFKDASLSKTPSIYRKTNKQPGKSIDTFTPSQEVLEADREKKSRTAALQKATEDARNEEAMLQARTSELAVEIRDIYESEYGTIDANHRQIPAQTQLEPEKSIEQPQPPETMKKLHPLQTATVKPGIETDPDIDYHISRFEPRLAELKDMARQIRRSTHEVTLSVKALRSNRPQTYWNTEAEPVKGTPPAETEAASSTQHAEQPLRNVAAQVEKPPSGSDIGIRLAAFLKGNDRPTFLFLAYSPDVGRVEISPLSWRVFRKHELHPGNEDMASVLTRLSRPSQYLQYFSPLEKEGYELYKGGSDSLVFKKVEKQALTTAEQAEISRPAMSSQIGTETQPSPFAAPQEFPKQAADVLDEIPAEVGPQPGPAAPTAPSPTSPKPRVMRRQEQVFSGQSLGRPTPHRISIVDEKKPAVVDDTVKSAKAAPEIGAGTSKQTRDALKESLWVRFNRGLRRVLLTGLAMAGFAYGVGVLAESIGAQQPQRKIESNEEYRRRTGRPGIYSTENSRW